MSKQPPLSEQELASNLATQLRATLGRIRRRLRDQGGRTDFTPSQIAVIQRLEQTGPATVSTLARAEAMRPQSMSTIIAALQQAGMIDGLADPHDGRKTLMSLNKKCEKWLKEGRAARQDWLTTTILQKLSAKEQRKLSKALQLLSRLTEEA